MNKNLKYGIPILIGIFIIVKAIDYQTNPKEFNIKIKECPQIEKKLIKKCIEKNGIKIEKKCKQFYTEKYITIDKITKLECKLAKIEIKLNNKN